MATKYTIDCKPSNASDADFIVSIYDHKGNYLTLNNSIQELIALKIKDILEDKFKFDVQAQEIYNVLKKA